MFSDVHSTVGANVAGMSIDMLMLRKMGSGRTSSEVVGDVWRKEHSSVGAPVWELGRGDI